MTTKRELANKDDILLVLESIEEVRREIDALRQRVTVSERRIQNRHAWYPEDEHGNVIRATR